MSIVSLVIAPSLAQIHGTGAHGQHNKIEKEVKVMIQNDEAGTNMDLQPLLDALKNDQLITDGSFSIALKEGKLFINDQEQSQEVFEKYASYLTGVKDFSIEKQDQNGSASE